MVAALFGLVHGQYFQEPKKIVSYSHDLGDTRGHYSFSYETEGGILQRESGSRKYAGTSDETQLIQGSVQYNAPDGTPIAMSWTADEFGTQVSGSHIPTPPPIPPAIQRALEWIAKQPTTPEPIEKNNPTQNAVLRSDNRQFRLSSNKRNWMRVLAQSTVKFIQNYLSFLLLHIDNALPIKIYFYRNFRKLCCRWRQILARIYPFSTFPC